MGYPTGRSITTSIDVYKRQFQATLCSVAGASEVFDGGFVTYAVSAKEQLLGVPVETVRQYGVVSKQTAEAMASGCQQKMGVDVGLSFTGVAGPDDLEAVSYTHLVLLVIPAVLLSGCESVTQRAGTQDTWSRIEKRGKVIVGLDDSFVPMGFRERDGKLVGYDIDLAKAVFKQYGIKVDFQTIDWSMKETELKNGTIDLIWNGYSMTPERAKQVADVYKRQGQGRRVATKVSERQGTFGEPARRIK